jgi:subtilisin family serine protease
MTMAGTPASATQEAIRHLADEEGITVVIAAGNQGCCDGVNPLGQLSTPGVLTVANYDDEGAASRDGSIHWSSSRCSAYQDAKRCPDLAAPGTGVISTRSSTSRGYTFHQFAPYYEFATGTSFSAPHVAGIAALLLDADPSLTPAEIEDVLEDTARPMEEEATLDDPTNEGSISVAAGHGLVDAAAALQDPRVEADASSIDKLPPVDSEPHVYPGKTVDAQPAGVPGQAPVAWTVPSGVESGIAERLVRTGNETAWPLETGQPCRFQISHDGQTFPADCDGGLIEDSGYEVFAATATYDFPEPGLYHVEAQIDFPNEGFQTIESFNVRAR